MRLTDTMLDNFYELWLRHFPNGDVSPADWVRQAAHTHTKAVEIAEGSGAGFDGMFRGSGA